MVVARWIVFGLLTTATVACAPGAEGIPACKGLQQISITSGAGSGYATREEAAIHALEISYEIDIDRVALAHEAGRHFRVVVADLTVLERPPRVSIERTEDGFLSDGLSC